MGFGSGMPRTAVPRLQRAGIAASIDRSTPSSSWMSPRLTIEPGFGEGTRGNPGVQSLSCLSGFAVGAGSPQADVEAVAPVDGVDGQASVEDVVLGSHRQGVA